MSRRFASTFGAMLHNVLDEPDPIDVFTVSASGSLVVALPAYGAKILVDVDAL